jgi:hypothetical protein
MATDTAAISLIIDFLNHHSQQVTRSLCEDMKMICNGIHIDFIKMKVNDMNIRPFNHVTILFYFGDECVRKLNLHRNILYSKDGVYSVSKNSQTEGTPTCILNFGDTRTLQFRLFKYQKQSKGTFQQKRVGRDGHYSDVNITLPHGSLFVLHEKDELPRLRFNMTEKSFYKYGNVDFGGAGKMSIAFVCRNCVGTQKVHRKTGRHFITPIHVINELLNHYDSIEMLKDYISNPNRSQKDMNHISKLYPICENKVHLITEFILTPITYPYYTPQKQSTFNRVH